MSFDREYQRRKDWRDRFGKDFEERGSQLSSARPLQLLPRQPAARPGKSELSSLERIKEFGGQIRDQEHAPKPRKDLKKRWGVEFYSLWFGNWKIHQWYSTAGERDRALARLEKNKATDHKGRAFRYRKIKR